MAYLMLIIFLLWLALAWRRLDWAVQLTIFALPAYLWRWKIVGLPTTALETMILTVVVVWLIKNFPQLLKNLKGNWRRRRIARRYPFDWEIILLLIVSIVAVGVSGWSLAALGLWRAYFLEPLLLFVVVFNLFGRERQWGKIIWPLAASALAIVAVGWYQQFVDITFLNPIWSQQTTPRITSVFTYSNAVGLYLAPLVMIFIGWLFYQRRQKSPWAVIGLLLLVAASILTIFFARSEGALVGLAAALGLFGLLVNRRAAIITAAVAICLAGSVYFLPAVRNYALEKLTLRDLAGEIRRQQWRETWQMLKADNRWLRGAGLANYQTAIKPFHQEGIFFNRDREENFIAKLRVGALYRQTHWQPLEIYLYPHNIFLNFWSELGLAGLILFIWLFVKFFYLGIKNLIGNWKLEIGNYEAKSEKYLILGLLGAMTVVLIHGLVDVPYFKNDLAVLFWLFLAMMGIINISHKKIIKEKL